MNTELHDLLQAVRKTYTDMLDWTYNAKLDCLAEGEMEAAGKWLERYCQLRDELIWLEAELENWED